MRPSWPPPPSEGSWSESVTEIRTYRLGDLVVSHNAARRPIKSSERVAGSTPYYGASGIVDYVDGSTHEGHFLLISEDGENLRSRSTPIAFNAEGRIWVNNHAHVVSGREPFDTRFLAYALAITDISGYLTGSAQPKLSKAAMESIRLPLPGPSERQAIAEVLGALDDKIAANTTVAALADELSRALFQAVATEGDQVPLSSLARFVNGRAFTKDATGRGRVVVRIAELNSGIGKSTVWNDIDVPDDNTARPGDLLFAWSGSLTAARWFRSEAIVNQHIFKVIPADGMPMWLVNQAVHAKLDEFKAIAADKATTMGHIQRRHLDEPVRVPDDGDVKRLDELMTGLWTTALAAEVESLKLVTTRDELLPLLMSGKVRVNDAEKTVEGVL